MRTSKVTKEKGELDYGVIKDKLLYLFEEIANKLEREWDPRYRHVDSASIMFLQMFRNAINHYNTIFYICADIPKDPDRKPVYSLSLPPLTRTLFEQLTMFLFLLVDIPNFVPYLFMTGYTELRIELEHCVKYHGTEKNWKPYIKHLKQRIAEHETKYKLTKRQIANPVKVIGRGPTPGGLLILLKNNRPSAPIIPFIEYLKSWLYRELSGQAHQNVLELAGKGSFFSIDQAQFMYGRDWETTRKAELEQYRQKQIIVAVTIMLAMATEIDVHFRYQQREKVMFLWTVLIEYSDITKDFWDTRYKALLN
jgi:hypothetical protein